MKESDKKALIKSNGDAPQKGVKDRVLDLEKAVLGLGEAYAKLATNYNTLLQTLDEDKFQNDHFKQKVSVTTESMAALVRLIRDGTEFTEENMTLAVSLNQEDRLIQQTQEMIEMKVLKEVDEIKKEDSYVVLKEFDQEGKIISMRSQGPLIKFTKELQERFVGKKVGEKLELKEGNVIEITRIYDIVEPEEPKIPSMPEDSQYGSGDFEGKDVEENASPLEKALSSPSQKEDLMQSDKNEEKQSNTEESSNSPSA